MNSFLLFAVFMVVLLLAAEVKTLHTTLKNILDELRRTRPVLDDRPATPAPLADTGRVEDSATSAASS